MNMLKKTSTIGNTAIILTLFAIISKATGFFREVLFANYFGTSREYEWFLIASVLPITINSIALYFYQNFFIPTYSRAIRSDNESISLVKGSFYLAVFTGLFVFLLLLITKDLVLEYYMGVNETSSKTEILFLIFCLTIPFSFVNAFLTSYSQTQYNFKAPAISILSINLFTIIAILLFKESGIIEISVGYLLGVLFQLAILLHTTKIFKVLLNKSHKKARLFSEKYNRIVWIILIEIIGQVYILSDRYFLSKVDEGGIAAINYALTIFQLPISIITISVSTAILPQMSEFVAKLKMDELKHKISETLTSILLLFVPISLVFILWGKEIISILFERGYFDSNSTYLTYNVLILLSVSLCFYSLYGIINKLFYVFDMVKTLFVITILGMMTKLLFNFILVDSLRQNGLALATTLSYLTFFVLSIIIIQSKKKSLEIKLLAKKFLTYLLNSIFAYLLVTVLFFIVTPATVWAGLFKILVFLMIYYLNNQILLDKNQFSLKTNLFKILNLKAR